MNAYRILVGVISLCAALLILVRLGCKWWYYNTEAGYNQMQRDIADFGFPAQFYVFWPILVVGICVFVEFLLTFNA